MGLGTSNEKSQAQAILAGDKRAISRLSTQVLRVRKDNFIERPWGGTQLYRYKNLTPAGKSRWIGESFEIAACASDPEVCAYPSVVLLEDGSEIELPKLLEIAAESLLGDSFVAQYGREFPVVPKVLDIQQLLSVQVHSPGNPELYIVLAADPEATIRLGWTRTVDRNVLRQFLWQGRQQQVQVAGAIAQLGDQERSAIASFFADREKEWADVLPPFFSPMALRNLTDSLCRLKEHYWHVLDLLTEIPVSVGQCFWNAVPGSNPLAADVHALGNPQQREILVLEIRKPARTFRLWDHVRFPMRAVHIEKGLQHARISPTTVDDFWVTPQSTPERNRERLVDCPLFVVDRIALAQGEDCFQRTGGDPRTIHCIKGEIAILGEKGAEMERLSRGESALVPVSLAEYQFTAGKHAAEIIQVIVPCSHAATTKQRKSK